MVNREFRCIGHDYEFESTEERPKCPLGCSAKFVQQEFRTPVGIRSRGTSIQDNMAKQLASDYGMTDMRNDKDGGSVMSNTPMRSGGARVEDHQRARWAPGIFQPQQGWAQRGEPAPVFNHQMKGTTTPMKPLLAKAPPLSAITTMHRPK